MSRMSRFRKNLNQPSVSLFPFLAVLICTLGVLIVMLVLAVKSAEVAKEEKQATQDQAAVEKIEEANQRLALEKYRSESVHGIRSDVLARLADSRDNRSYLQQDVANATKELDAASKKLKSLKRTLANAEKSNPAETDPAETQAKEAAIEALKQQIAQAKQALANQRKKSEQQGPSRFSIVPHRGSGGTFRRPIFLECLENEIRLQPLGIVLRKQDFVSPIQAGNPLDVALLTIQEHWQQLDVAGEHGSPYPLLVVRPNGAETFVLARRAMKSWTDEFGYELVDTGKELDFGVPDSILTAKVDKVIQSSIDQQFQLAQRRYERAQYLSQFSSNRTRPGFSASTRNGGSVTTSAYQSSASGSSNVSSVGSDSNWSRSGSRNSSSIAQQTSYQSNQNRSSSGNSRTFASNGTSQSGSNQNRTSQSGFSSSGGGSTSQNYSASNRNSNNVAGSNGNGSTFGTSGPQGLNSNGSNSKQSGQSSSSSSGSSAPNLASRRGQGWALPSRNQGGTGYLRPITVVCAADHLRIKTADGVEKTIDYQSGAVAAVDVLVEEIWRRIDSWGIAGQGSFWKPQLRIQTAPGGEQRVIMLQRMLHNSGLVIETGGAQ